NKGPNVLNQFNQQNNFPNAPATGVGATVTTDQVLAIIQKQDGYLPLLDDPNQKQALALQYNISDMPEVRAINQEGIDTRREGLDFGKIADLSDALLLDD